MSDTTLKLKTTTVKSFDALKAEWEKRGTYTPRFDGINATTAVEADASGYDGDDFQDREAGENEVIDAPADTRETHREEAFLQAVGGRYEEDPDEQDALGITVRIGASVVKFDTASPDKRIGTIMTLLSSILPVDAPAVDTERGGTYPYQWMRYRIFTGVHEMFERMLLTEFEDRSNPGQIVRRGLIAKRDMEAARFLQTFRSGGFVRNPGLGAFIQHRVQVLNEQITEIEVMMRGIREFYIRWAVQQDIDIPMMLEDRKTHWQRPPGVSMDGATYEAAVMLFGKAKADEMVEEAKKGAIEPVKAVVDARQAAADTAAAAKAEKQKKLAALTALLTDLI